MTRSKILVLDSIHVSALEKLRKVYDVTVEIKPKPEVLYNIVSDVDVIVLRSGVKLTQEVLSHAKKLRVIARAGNGIDNIDVEFAKKQDITVFRIPSVSSRSVAELGIGLMVALGRKIVLSDSLVRQNIWQKENLSGIEFIGKTAGVVGLGSIGNEVAKICEGLSMKILASVRNFSSERKHNLKKRAIELVDLEILLQNSDIVFLTLPLNNESDGLFNSQTFLKMKENSLLINLSRAKIIDCKALLKALDDKSIAGVATDVPHNEGIANPLSLYENTVITPHIGAMTEDAQQRIGDILVKNIGAALDNKDVEHKV